MAHSNVHLGRYSHPIEGRHKPINKRGRSALKLVHIVRCDDGRPIQNRQQSRQSGQARRKGAAHLAGAYSSSSSHTRVSFRPMRWHSRPSNVPPKYGAGSTPARFSSSWPNSVQNTVARAGPADARTTSAANRSVSEVIPRVRCNGEGAMSSGGTNISGRRWIDRCWSCVSGCGRSAFSTQVPKARHTSTDCSTVRGEPRHWLPSCRQLYNATSGLSPAHRGPIAVQISHGCGLDDPACPQMLSSRQCHLSKSAAQRVALQPRRAHWTAGPRHLPTTQHICAAGWPNRLCDTGTRREPQSSRR